MVMNGFYMPADGSERYTIEQICAVLKIAEEQGYPAGNRKLCRTHDDCAATSPHAKSVRRLEVKPMLNSLLTI